MRIRRVIIFHLGLAHMLCAMEMPDIHESSPAVYGSEHDSRAKEVTDAQKANEIARNQLWGNLLREAPAAFRAEPAHTLAFLGRVTDDVIAHKSCIASLVAQRLFKLALFCQTKDLLIKASEKSYTLWRMLEGYRNRVEHIRADTVTNEMIFYLRLFNKCEVLAVDHTSQECIGSAQICKKCERVMNMLTKNKFVGTCCKETVLPTIHAAGFVCQDCLLKLKHAILEPLKEVVIALRECQVMPVTPKDIELLKWAICYDSNYRISKKAI